MKNTITAITVLLALLLASVPASGLTGELVVEGTGDSQALLKEISWHFTRVHSAVALEIPESLGSTGGITALRKLEAELARVSRSLTGEEKRDGLKEVVFARTPLVFVVHPGVKDMDNITSEQVADIYSGKITMWEDLGGGPFKIYPVTREPGDGLRLLLENKIPGLKDIEMASRAKTAYSSPEAAKIIGGHKNTIGYLPMTVAHRSGLKVLKLDGVYPSVENVRNGSYPFAVPLSFVHRGRISPVAKAFVNFLFGPVARDVIKKYGSIPVDRR